MLRLTLLPLLATLPAALAGWSDAGATDTAGGDTAWLVLGGGGVTDTGYDPDLCRGPKVRINEFLSDPAGSDSTAKAEWIELYNPGPDANLSGWRLSRTSQAAAWDTMFTFPDGTILPRDGYLLVREVNAPFAPLSFEATLQLYSGTGGDGVRLENCEGEVKDVVVYGTDYANPDGIEDEWGRALSVALRPGTDQSAARLENGVDNDAPAVDFLVSDAPTPGAANPVVRCTNETIHISEVLVNPAGTDSLADAEYIELFNPNPYPVAVDNYRIDRATQPGAWSTAYTLPYGTWIDAHDFLVIGGTNARHVDLRFPGLDFPSGSHGDALLVVDCQGAWSDLLIYGDDNADGITDRTGRVTSRIAPKPGDDEVLVRNDEYAESGYSDVDFTIGEPTIGSSNLAGLTPDSGWANFDTATGGFVDPANDTGAVADTGAAVDSDSQAWDTASATDAPDAAGCSLAMEGGVVINELLPDPAGSDATALGEWIELYAPIDADLSGWRIERASSGGNWDEMVTLPAGTTMSAGGTFLIREANAPTAAHELVAGLQMYSGTGGDGVRLVDCEGHVVDTVVYGDSNADAIEDESGNVTSSVAPKPGSNQSIARLFNGEDADQPGTDFAIADLPTPGTANPELICETGEIHISELLVNPAGTDSVAKREYIELYNNGSTPIALDGWRVESATQGIGAWSVEADLPAGLTIQPGDFFVIAASNAGFGDLIVDIDLPSGSNGDAVRLVDCSGAVIDLVLYGEDNDDGFLDEQGQFTASIAPKPGDDEVLVRDDERLDSDDSGVDFRLDVGSPGDTNRRAGGGGGGGDVALDTAALDSGNFDTGGPGRDSGGGGPIGGSSCDAADVGVTINELLSDPAGTDSAALAEWIELYAEAPADLSGWRLERASQAGDWDEMIAFPAGTAIDANGFLLVREENAPTSGNDLLASLQLYSGTNGDAVRLVDCDGNVADTVIYGDDNDDGHVGDDGDVATSVAPKPGSDESIARLADGQDSDISGDDFAIADAPTPGAPNPVSVCEAGGTLLITEFFANPTGSDAAAASEWVEIYNPGPAPVQLDGWTIVSASRPDSTSIEAEIPNGVTIGAGEFLVIGAPNAPVRDVPVDALDLPSGSNGDALQLVDCAGALIDVVVYGEDNDDALGGEDGAVWTSVAPKPGDDEVVGRLDIGTDNDDASDWAIVGTPTPGGPNDFAPPVDTDGPEPKICAAAAGSGLVINELLADPAGSDSVVLTEWVELYNGGNETLDLSGWQLQRTSKPDEWDEQVTIPDGTTLASGQFLVITEQNGPAAPGSIIGLIQLYSGTDTDGVRITDCNGNAADTVLYGPPGNTDQLVGDDGLVATSVAPDPGSDEALARRLDGQDTNDNGADFVTTATPSPGAPNPRFTCTVDDAIVINEFLPDPTGADGDVDAEWVELFNPRNEAVDLTGWALASKTKADSNPSTEFELPSGAVIPAQGFLVIGGQNVPFADFNAEPFDLPSGSGGDALLLIDCQGADVDVALYGGANTDVMLEQTGDAPTNVGPDPGSDEVIARASNGLDTDVCATDFVIARNPSPGAENPTVAPPVCEGDAVIVINEALVNPTGSDSDALAEWIELYNPGDAPVRLDGWTVSTISSFDAEDGANNETEKVALPTGTVIDPGGYYVIGDINVPEADFVLERAFSLGSGSGGDGIALRSCDGDLADQLLYGDTNDDGLLGEDGIEADNLPPSPAEAECLARRQDGLDTNADARDFQATAECTPGETNPEAEEIDCEPASEISVVINELLPDPEGTDAGFEWIELYNPTDERISLDGWYLQIDSFDAIDLILPGGIDIEPRGYFIIGGPQVQHSSDPEWTPDVETALSIGNSSDGAGVRLLDCNGDRVDTVVWGTTNENNLRDDLGVAPEPPSKRPGSGQTIARVEDGVDTNAVDDWKVGAPTLAAANAVEIDPNDELKPGGCGRGSADGRGTGARCDGTGADRSWAAVGAVLLAALRRKRR